MLGDLVSPVLIIIWGLFTLLITVDKPEKNNN
ncbi:hypothetical protein MOVI109754_19085 [Moritella viscosa]